jgi:signal transduction histidine kinase
MHPYLTALSLVAGICFAFGILYLFIGLRRKHDRGLNLTFAFFALSYAAAVLSGIGNYSATSVAGWLSSARWDGVFVVSTWLLLIWYVTIYTRVKPRLFLGLLAAVFISTGIAHVSGPNLIHEEIFDLAYVTLPWGEQLAYVEATDSLWSTVFLLANLVAIGFILVACFIQFRRGERQPALTLGVGMAWFIATILVDLLVDLGIAPIYLGDFGFLGLAIVMGIQMSNDIIRTEEELAGYRRSLELLVDERTSRLQRVNEELAALNRIAQTVSTVTDLPTALTQVSEILTELFHASHTYVILPEDGLGDLHILAGFGRESGRVEGTPLPLSLSETPHTHQVLSQAESLVLPEVQSLPLATPVNEFLTDQNISSLMLVPLVVHGAATGLLFVASDQASRVFTADEVRLAETVAADVAGAIENARLTEQARAAAVSKERGRIARDLHDSVTQSIYSASLIAEALPGVWERNPDQVRGNLTTLLQLIRGALAEMRTLLFELRPTALEEASLGRLLHQLADVLTGRTRIPVEVTVPEQIELPAEVRIALYRIAQEVFNNILKHAQATQVTATLQALPDSVLLTIQDNGRGFDPESVPAERLGIRIMRERAQGVGAELAIRSEPGRGTEVRVEWKKDEGRRTEDGE